MIRGVALVLLLLTLNGCHSAPPPPPTTRPVDDTGEAPLPPASAARTYIEQALADKTRLIEVYASPPLDGALDDRGRGRLRSAIPKWWSSVDVVSTKPKAGELPFRVTPDLGIRIYPPGTAKQTGDDEEAPPKPDVDFMIYKARRITRVIIADSTQPAFANAVYVIPNPLPMEWVNRLFAGKL